MPTELTDIEVEEVSLVDRPANPGAQVLLHKRDGKTAVKKTSANPLPTSIREHLTMPAEPKATYIRKSDTTISVMKMDQKSEVVFYKDDADYFMGEAEEATGGEVGQVLEALFKGCAQLVQAEAAPEEKMQHLQGLFEEANQMIGTQLLGSQDEPGMLMKCFVGGLSLAEKVQPAAADGDVDVTKAAGGEGDQDVDANNPVIKALQEEIRLLKSAAESRDQVAGVAEIRERLVKAHQDPAMAETLYTVKKGSPETFETIMKGYEAAGTRIAKAGGLTTEIGGTGTQVSFSKRAEMETLVADLRKSQPSLSHPAAYAQVLKSNAAMRAAYDAGQL